MSRMTTTRRHAAVGREALALVTQLLHRMRLADPTAGLWEAADFEWWWRMPRRSDAIDQLFWLDRDGPVAAAMLTDWRDELGLDPIVMPDARTSLKREVWEIGLEAVGHVPDDLVRLPVGTQVQGGDTELASFLLDHGFRAGDTGGTAWMPASTRSALVAPPDGFEIVDRAVRPDDVHWMARRSGPAVEARLRETTLYDPGLDLSVRA